MKAFKQIVSLSMAVAMAAGVVMSAGSIEAAAAEPVEQLPERVLADVEVEAQTLDGELHSVNEVLLPEAVLEIGTEELIVNFSVIDTELEFEENEVFEVEAEVLETEDEEVPVNTYSLAIVDIDEMILTRVEGEEEAEEFFIVINLGEEEAEEVLEEAEEEAEVAAEEENEEAEEVLEAAEEEAEVAAEKEAEAAAEETEAAAIAASAELPEEAEVATASAATSLRTLLNVEASEEETTGPVVAGSLLATVSAAVNGTADDSSEAEVKAAVPTAVKATDLADGEYKINVEAREVDSNSVHLRNEDLKKEAKLIVSNGSIDVYFTSVGRPLTFQNSSGSFEDKTESTYEPEESEIRSDGVNLSIENNYKVTVASLDEDIIAKFPAGGSADGALTFRIVLLEDSLSVVSLADDSSDDSDSDTTTTSGSSSSSKSSSSVKTGDDTSVVLLTLTFIFTGAFMFIMMYNDKKRMRINIIRR